MRRIFDASGKVIKDFDSQIKGSVLEKLLSLLLECVEGRWYHAQ
jgi:hypothetical protein